MPTPPTRKSKSCYQQLKVFKEDEFADLLHQCHNVIRNREKKDPAAAFDEIAKILFVKVCVERELRSKRRRKNLFTAIPRRTDRRRPAERPVREDQSSYYRDDQIFDDDERINLKPATGREIVRSWSATTCPIPARTSRASPLSVSWAAPFAAKSASSSRRAPSSSSWSAWSNPRKATSSAIRPAAPAAS